jgi:hypothetical protein
VEGERKRICEVLNFKAIICFYLKQRNFCLFVFACAYFFFTSVNVVYSEQGAAAVCLLFTALLNLAGNTKTPILRLAGNATRDGATRDARADSAADKCPGGRSAAEPVFRVLPRGAGHGRARRPRRRQPRTRPGDGARARRRHAGPRVRRPARRNRRRQFVTARRTL